MVPNYHQSSLILRSTRLSPVGNEEFQIYDAEWRGRGSHFQWTSVWRIFRALGHLKRGKLFPMGDWQTPPLGLGMSTRFSRFQSKKLSSVRNDELLTFGQSSKNVYGFHHYVTFDSKILRDFWTLKKGKKLSCDEWRTSTYGVRNSSKELTFSKRKDTKKLHISHNSRLESVFCCNI